MMPKLKNSQNLIQNPEIPCKTYPRNVKFKTIFKLTSCTILIELIPAHIDEEIFCCELCSIDFTHRTDYKGNKPIKSFFSV